MEDTRVAGITKKEKPQERLPREGWGVGRVEWVGQDGVRRLGLGSFRDQLNLVSSESTAVETGRPGS